MKILGITGGVGSGKSRILDELKEVYGAYIVEADKLAHELMKPGKTIYNKIVEVFGKDILNDASPYEINRVKLGEIVFSDNEKLEILNSISHPLVKESIIGDINEKKKSGDVNLFVIEAALLIQDGYDKICDEIWYIWASRESRTKRLMKQRGYTEEKCKMMYESQADDSYYKEHSDYVINNDSDYEIASKQLKEKLNIFM